VYAETGAPLAQLGTIVLGIIGAAAIGPLGALCGAIIGAGIGKNIDERDRNAVEVFNSS